MKASAFNKYSELASKTTSSHVGPKVFIAGSQRLTVTKIYPKSIRIQFIENQHLSRLELIRVVKNFHGDLHLV